MSGAWRSRLDENDGAIADTVDVLVAQRVHLRSNRSADTPSKNAFGLAYQANAA
jgi:hypothetical protein